MPPLHRLSATSDIEEFVDGFERASGYRVPADRSDSSMTFGMRRRGRIIGGVMIRRQAPFRTMTLIPEAARPPVASAIEGTNTVELTCVWLDRAHRNGLRSVLLWYGIYLVTGRAGGDHLLFGTGSASLRRLYMIGKPRLLYSGPVTIGGREMHGWVFHAPPSYRRTALLRLIPYKLGFLRPAAQRSGHFDGRADFEFYSVGVAEEQ
jgi:hypothetical protein